MEEEEGGRKRRSNIHTVLVEGRDENSVDRGISLIQKTCHDEMIIFVLLFIRTLYFSIQYVSKFSKL